jgi:hypothetical protein
MEKRKPDKRTGRSYETESKVPVGYIIYRGGIVRGVFNSSIYTQGREDLEETSKLVRETQDAEVEKKENRP